MHVKKLDIAFGFIAINYWTFLFLSVIYHSFGHLNHLNDLFQWVGRELLLKNYFAKPNLIWTTSVGKDDKKVWFYAPTAPQGEILLGYKNYKIGVFFFNIIFLGTDQKIEYILMITKKSLPKLYISFPCGRGFCARGWSCKPCELSLL